MIRASFFVIAAVAGLIGLVLSLAFREAVVTLAIGWLIYLRRVLPEVTVRWDGVAFFLIGLGIFSVLVHRIACWLRREIGEGTVAWRWRSTCLVVGLLVVMFVAGIAMVGIVHQVAWLLSDSGPLLTPALALRGRPSTDLRQASLAVHNFSDTYHRIPGPAIGAAGEPEHSWITYILPYFPVHSEMDTQKPWDHSDNQLFIRKLVPQLLNPDVRPLVVRDSNGYGVSHYAGNVHVFEALQPKRLEEFSAGASNTLMIGEVATNFQAWARPRANRDPAVGLNRSATGFGSPDGSDGVSFAMADGSVRRISQDIDPNVLAQLAKSGNHDESPPRRESSR